MILLSKSLGPVHVKCIGQGLFALCQVLSVDSVRNSGASMLSAGAGERNKTFILDALKEYLPPPGTAGIALEVASGPGQHVTYFAKEYPHVQWQPTDIEKQYHNSIAAHIEHTGVSNVRPPVYLDITQPTNTADNGNVADQSYDLILNINMVHISPWETALGLFNTAGRALKPNGILFMYGPFKINGSLTPESNVCFDESLRARDPRWGIRDVADLQKLAEKNGLQYLTMVDMPANNKCLSFRKVS